MEIQDYLRAVRNRLWLPVLVPVVAAAATVGILYKQPQQYSSTATVIVPALSAKGYSTSAVTQYLSTYKDVLSSAPLANQVAKETGATPAEVTKCAASTVSASSNIIEVTCASTNKDMVVPMTQAAAVDGLDSLLLPAQAQAQNQVNTARQQLDGANKQLQQFTEQTGSFFPENDYKLESGVISALLTQQTGAQISGDTARVNALKAVIAQHETRLTTLAGEVSTWQGFNDTKTSALAAYNKANDLLLQVRSEISSNHATGSVVTKDNGREARVSTIIRFGLIAYAVALLLCLAVLALLEFMRPTRLTPAVAGAGVPATARISGAAPAAAGATTNGNGHAHAANHTENGNGAALGAPTGTHTEDVAPH